MPVMVWVEAPVRRIRLASPKFTLLEVPVVLKSVPFLKATLDVTSRSAPSEVLPPLTVKVLVPAIVVLPFKVFTPVDDWKLPDEADKSKLPLPEAKLKFLLAATVV